jgi:hypothetical protein
MRTAEQHRRLKAWHWAHRRFAAGWRAEYGDLIPVPRYPILPIDLIGPAAGPWLCGTRTRRGTPCRRAAVLSSAGIPRNGRCRLHGGCSTGPWSAEGKAKVTANLRPKRQPADPLC